MKRRELIKKALTATLPVMAAYLVIGVGFGMLARSVGIGDFGTVLMSLTIYAGAAQYVGAELFREGAPLFTIALTTLFVNIRHLFYGFSMLEKYRGSGAAKPYLMFSLTDETYSLVAAGPEDLPEEGRKAYFLWVSLFDQLYWVLGTAAGVLAGALFRFNTEGIEFSLTALFLTIFLNHWRTGELHGASLIGLFSSAAMLLLFGKENFLLPAMLLIVGLLFLFRGRLEGKK